MPDMDEIYGRANDPAGAASGDPWGWLFLVLFFLGFGLFCWAVTAYFERKNPGITRIGDERLHIRRGPRTEREDERVARYMRRLRAGPHEYNPTIDD